MTLQGITVEEVKAFTDIESITENREVQMAMSRQEQPFCNSRTLEYQNHYHRCWNGHTLRETDTNITKQTLSCNPQRTEDVDRETSGAENLKQTPAGWQHMEYRFIVVCHNHHRKPRVVALYPGLSVSKIVEVSGVELQNCKSRSSVVPASAVGTTQICASIWRGLNTTGGNPNTMTGSHPKHCK